MNESRWILVDTNVILDVTKEDAQWVDWSQAQISRLTGRLLINPMIYAELCYEADHTEDVDAVMQMLGLRYMEFSRQALLGAAQSYHIYRRRGGTKTAPLPDFFIGAHAAALGIPILTRDVSRYQTYFPTVPLIRP